MAAVAPPKPRQETWIDWLPAADPTLTIEEVIDGLNQRGIDNVTIDNIRFWQRKGVLPAPIRRKLGQEKGKARALYPPQAVDAIAQVRALQHNGMKLRSIRQELARMFGQPVTFNATDSTKLKATESLSVKKTLSATGAAVGTSHAAAEATIERRDARAGLQPVSAHGEASPITVTVREPDAALLKAVFDAATWQERRTGSPIRQVTVTFDDDQVEVTFTDTRSRKFSHVLPIDATTDENQRNII